RSATALCRPGRRPARRGRRARRRTSAGRRGRACPVACPGQRERARQPEGAAAGSARRLAGVRRVRAARRGARPGASREFLRHREPRLPLLRVPHLLPGSARGTHHHGPAGSQRSACLRERRMSGEQNVVDERDLGAANTVLLRDESHLCDVLGVPFSDQQLAAITAPLERPLAIIAGAGSGKTAVMAARVVWLVGRGLVSPDAVLGLTFTNKAASELAARIRSALGLLADDAGIHGYLDDGEPTVSTYHAYAGALLSEHGLRIVFEPALRIVSDASRFQRAAQAVQSHRGAIANLTTHLPTTVCDVIHLDGQLNDHLVTIEDLLAYDKRYARELDLENAERKRPLKKITQARDTAAKRDELAAVIAEYRDAKARDPVPGVADQMAQDASLATRSAERSPDQRGRFAVVLLDEYQDTSVAQRRMLQGIFSGATVQDGRGHPVTAVGDPCQAIYGWRGASIENLTGFLDHFPAADGGRGALLNLTVNRRCSRRVLDLANSLARPLYDATDVVQPLEPRADAPDGGMVAACLETVVDEVDWVVGEVQRARERESIDWSDIAIL